MKRLKPHELEERDWCFPAFGVSKSNVTIRIVIDFRKINHQLRRRQYPLDTIEQILNSTEKFLSVTNLDLNMGYMAIPLNPAARKLLTICFPFGF